MTAKNNIAQIAQDSFFSFISNFKILGFREIVPSLIIFKDAIFSIKGEFSFIPFIGGGKNTFSEIAEFIKVVIARFDEDKIPSFTFSLFSDIDGKFDFDNFRDNRDLTERIKRFADFIFEIRQFIAKGNFRPDIKFSLVPILQDEASDSGIFIELIDFIKQELRQFGVDDIEFRRSPAPSAAAFEFDNISHEIFGSFNEFEQFNFDAIAGNNNFIFIFNDDAKEFSGIEGFNFENGNTFMISDTDRFIDFTQENDIGFSGNKIIFAFRKIFTKAS